MLSMILAALRHNEEDRPRRALPSRGVIRARVGASTFDTNVVSSNASMVCAHSSGLAMTEISCGTRCAISSFEIAEQAAVRASMAMF